MINGALANAPVGNEYTWLTPTPSKTRNHDDLQLSSYIIVAGLLDNTSDRENRKSLGTRLTFSRRPKYITTRTSEDQFEKKRRCDPSDSHSPARRLVH